MPRLRFKIFTTMLIVGACAICFATIKHIHMVNIRNNAFRATRMAKHYDSSAAYYRGQAAVATSPTKRRRDEALARMFQEAADDCRKNAAQIHNNHSTTDGGGARMEKRTSLTGSDKTLRREFCAMAW